MTKKISSYDLSNPEWTGISLNALSITTECHPAGDHKSLLNPKMYKRITSALKRGVAISEEDDTPCRVAVNYVEFTTEINEILEANGYENVNMTLSELAEAVQVKDRRVLNLLRGLDSGKITINHQNALEVERALKVVYGVWMATGRQNNEKSQARKASNNGNRRNNNRRKAVSATK